MYCFFSLRWCTAWLYWRSWTAIFFFLWSGIYRLGWMSDWAQDTSKISSNAKIPSFHTHLNWQRTRFGFRNNGKQKVSEIDIASLGPLQLILDSTNAEHRDTNSFERAWSCVDICSLSGRWTCHWCKYRDSHSPMCSPCYTIGSSTYITWHCRPVPPRKKVKRELR
jgi:hypothetical protein